MLEFFILNKNSFNDFMVGINGFTTQSLCNHVLFFSSQVDLPRIENTFLPVSLNIL